MIDVGLLHAAFHAALLGISLYMAVIGLVYFGMMVLGFFVLRSYGSRLLRTEREALFKSPLVPRISILVAAHDESRTILESVRALLTLRYPDYEVIVVNDGSIDDTLERLTDAFRLEPVDRLAVGTTPTRAVRGLYASRDPIPLVVVDKERGGKADALNAALNVARAPLVAVVDADSILEPDSLLQVMKPFLDDGDDERTLASGGIVRIIDGCHVEHGRVIRVAAPPTLLGAFQAIEYLRAFLGGRVAYSFLNALLVISGAFGVFRRDAVERAGGFDTRTVGEDVELVTRLHRGWRLRPREAVGPRPVHRIVFVPEPVSWTEAPSTLRALARQRNRWQRGLAESLWRHRAMLLNPRYGILGLFAMPYFVLFEMLGPTVELCGYALSVIGLVTGLAPPTLVVLFFLVSVGFGVLLSAAALLLEELTVRRYPGVRDTLRLLAAAVVENFGLRQLLAVWRTRALWDAARGKQDWGAVERRGFPGRAPRRRMPA